MRAQKRERSISAAKGAPDRKGKKFRGKTPIKRGEKKKKKKKRPACRGGKPSFLGKKRALK